MFTSKLANDWIQRLLRPFLFALICAPILVQSAFPSRPSAATVNDITFVQLRATKAALLKTAAFNTITVNSLLDDAVMNSNCTLREAILAANTNTAVDACLAGAAGLDMIQFSIGAGTPTINVQSVLPTITEPVQILGNTGGATRVELNGAVAGAFANGLVITVGGSTISRLVINRFSGGSGILIQTGGGNIVQNCLLGLNATGTAPLPNNEGVRINSSSGNNVAGNVVSGNLQSGIVLANATATGNQVQGNFIGTDETGTAALGNGTNGILIVNAATNVIGGTTAGARNLISGNLHGIFIGGATASGNQVLGNFIGTNVSGTGALGNSQIGVFITGGPTANFVGGTAAGARNLISGNGAAGVELFGNGVINNLVQGNFIGTDVNGTTALGNFGPGVLLTNAPNNTIGGTAAGAGNVISGNGNNGVLFTGVFTTGNLIQGNFIGTDSTGNSALANIGSGVFFTSSAASNTIGGTAAGAGNVISGNGQHGVQITGASSTSNILQGNVIGLDDTVMAAVPNGRDGVNINGAPGNTVGGVTAAARNLISGNGDDGVDINGAASMGNQVQGNFIGTDLTGTLDLGNTASGVQIMNAPGNTVGGTAAGTGNVIAGNNVNNVFITGNTASANQVQGNLIGLNAGGTAAIGGTTDGVSISDAPSNTIGGQVSAARNFISGHTRFGINIFGAMATGNAVQGNFIGLNSAGAAAIANTSAGVAVSDTTGTVIGGVAAGAGNVISGNGTGIDLFSGTGTQIQGNLIGTNPAGTAAIGNVFEGINVRASSAITIGGTTAAARNITSGNGQFGINITSLGTGGNIVQGNYIGTDAAGTAAIANSAGGVALGAANNTLGGTASGAGNLISGNGNRGVLIGGPAATGNQVQGNFIGTNAAGTAALGNSINGVEVINALNNTIGGTTAAARNIISGNIGDGVLMESTGLPTTGNLLQGNFIGADVGGNSDLGNGNNGVLIRSFNDVTSNTVGGAAAGAGNVISGNGAVGAIASDGVELNGLNATGNIIQGNFIGTNAAGTAALGNSGSGMRVGGAGSNTVGGLVSGARNVISGNAQHGILFNGFADGNQVVGNFIGTDVNGTADLGNTLSGVALLGGARNSVIGGTTAAARNVISGNNQHGVLIMGASDAVFLNLVSGNFIGTNAAGTAALANSMNGVHIDESVNNTIGGTVAGAGNVISGNTQSGVVFTNTAQGNQVQGNLIGTNAAGTAALGNGLAGVEVTNGSNNTIGGGAGAGNVISGNNFAGVLLLGGAATGNFVQGNLIGTNAAGTGALGNTFDGVRLDGCSGNTIGGATAAARNVISGNNRHGIFFAMGASGNLVQGNFIGTQSNGTSALGNSSFGVEIFEFSSNNTIGGSTDTRNIIAFNQAGVDVTSGTGNRISNNAIFSNSALGIDLIPTGVNPNDAGDPDNLANKQQNFPMLTSVKSDGTITGSLDSLAANSAYPVRIEFFGNTACDASGNGEGEVFLGSATVAAPGGFSAMVTLVAGKNFITATATDNNGNTSEFSACAKANTAPTISVAAPLTRQQGSPATNSQIATVSDPDQALNTLMDMTTPLTGTGVTISNVVINTTGIVMADVVASCTATTSTFTLTVTDMAGETAMATLTVNVMPNTIPMLSYANPQSVVAGQTLMVSPATGPSDNGSVASIAVQGVGAYTGVIGVSPAGVVSLSNAKPAGAHTITIRATDNCGAITDAVFTLNVTCPAITLSPVSLMNATTGSNVTENITASGGIAPYSFAVSGGALPAGITLTPAGLLSGTPTQAGVFNFTVTATDSTGCTGQFNYQLVVACTQFPVSITAPPMIAAGQNMSFDVTITNPCPNLALNTTLTTATPSNTTFQSISSVAGWTCMTPAVGGTGAISCTNAAFAALAPISAAALIPNAPNTTAIFTIVLNVNAGTPLGTVINNIVNVAGTSPGLPPNTATANGSTTVNSVAGTDISVTNTTSPTAIAGANATFNITVTNNTVGTAATAVRLTDAIPLGTTFQSLTAPAGWICATPAVGGTGTITCDLASMATGSANFVLAVRLNPNVPCDTTISDTASAQSSVTDPAPGNNSATASLLSKTQSDLAVNVAAPANALPDVSVIYTVTVSNLGPSDSFNTMLNNALPAAFSTEVINTSAGACTGVGTNSIACNLGTLAAGATATITIQVHVPQTCQSTTAVNTATVTTGNCLADPVAANNSQTRTTIVQIGSLGPGACIPSNQPISAQKPGSILFGGIFASGATGGPGGDPGNNTAVSLTNVHPTIGVVLHLFFVDGATCSVADAFICLTPNQTTRFLMSDLDPGVAGYMMMMAVDGPPGTAGGHNTGCPISFNYLIGSAQIKMTNSPRRETELASEGCESQFGSPLPGCDPNKSFAEIPFDGSPQGFNKLPLVLGVSNIPSRADGNDTLLLLARIDGNWGTGLKPLGNIFGILYDDAENAHSFSFDAGGCLLRSVISNNFPRTAPRFEQVIPSGRSGWMKLWPADNAAIIGAIINRHPNADSLPNAFDGGHNLHVLRLNERVVVTVPVFPPSC